MEMDACTLALPMKATRAGAYTGRAATGPGIQPQLPPMCAQRP